MDLAVDVKAVISTAEQRAQQQQQKGAWENGLQAPAAGRADCGSAGETGHLCRDVKIREYNCNCFNRRRVSSRWRASFWVPKEELGLMIVEKQISWETVLKFCDRRRRLLVEVRSGEEGCKDPCT